MIGCIGLAYAAAYLAAAFLTLKWIYRVNRNACGWRVRRLTDTQAHALSLQAFEEPASG